MLCSLRQLNDTLEVQETLELFRNSKHNRIFSIILVQQWIEHWRGAKKRTALSYSGLKFGCYKAHTFMLEIVVIKCKLVNLSIISR